MYKVGFRFRRRKKNVVCNDLQLYNTALDVYAANFNGTGIMVMVYNNII